MVKPVSENGKNVSMSTADSNPSKIQKPPAEMLENGTMKYGLAHADLGNTSTNIPINNFAVFGEAKLQGYLDTPLTGIRYDNRNFSTKIGVAGDVLDNNTYGFISTGYSPKITNTGNMMSFRRNNPEGIYADIRGTVTKFIGSNTKLNKDIAFDGYVGGKYILSNRLSVSSGVRFNNLLPGKKEFSADITKIIPLTNDVKKYDRGELQSTFYLKGGVTSSKSVPINYGITAGFQF